MRLIVEIQAVGDQLLEFDIGGTFERTPSTISTVGPRTFTAEAAAVVSPPFAPVTTAIASSIPAGPSVFAAFAAPWTLVALLIGALFSWRTRRTILAPGRTRAFRFLRSRLRRGSGSSARCSRARRGVRGRLRRLGGRGFRRGCYFGLNFFHEISFLAAGGLNSSLVLPDSGRPDVRS
jgi:hypothetical protein